MPGDEDGRAARGPRGPRMSRSAAGPAPALTDDQTFRLVRRVRAPFVRHSRSGGTRPQRIGFHAGQARRKELLSCGRSRQFAYKPSRSARKCATSQRSRSSRYLFRRTTHVSSIRVETTLTLHSLTLPFSGEPLFSPGNDGKGVSISRSGINVNLMRIFYSGNP